MEFDLSSDVTQLLKLCRDFCGHEARPVNPIAII
jgi:hypothetical protein